MMRGAYSICWVVLAVLSLSWGAVLASDFSIDWYTVDGGGTDFAAGGSLELAGTIGQPDASTMSGGTLELTGGYQALPACWCLSDMNNDGYRDGSDIQMFLDCVFDAGGDCSCAELSVDGALDLEDVSLFVQDLLNGDSCL